MSYIYIIRSSKNHRYYIGSTTELERRLKEHNRGKTPSTRHLTPWLLVFSHEVDDVREARKIERKLKSFKNKKILDKIVATGEIEIIV